jgi:hypothetical protein
MQVIRVEDQMEDYFRIKVKVNGKEFMSPELFLDEQIDYATYVFQHKGSKKCYFRNHSYQH